MVVIVTSIPISSQRLIILCYGLDFMVDMWERKWSMANTYQHLHHQPQVMSSWHVSASQCPLKNPNLHNNPPLGSSNSFLIQKLSMHWPPAMIQPLSLVVSPWQICFLQPFSLNYQDRTKSITLPIF